MIDDVVPGKNLSPTTLVAIVVLITLFYSQNVDITETTTTESRDYERHLISLQAFGSSPINHYPLDRCQGDCDLDSECRGQLICFQRRGYESVPGCDGGREDSTPSDYCVDPADLTAQPLLAFLGINPPIREFPLQECEGDCDRDLDCAPGLVCLQRQRGDLPVPGCGGVPNGLTDYCVKRFFDQNSMPYPSSILNFGLKLYWQKSYRWQEEDFDRRWCMTCRNGSCSYGDKTYIDTCLQSTSQRYDFVFMNNDEILIRIHDSNLCFERIAFDIFLYECDPSNQRQMWVAQDGDFRGTRFEISPYGLQSHCITQRHHPKAFEEVELEPCSRARLGDTSFWNRY